MPVSSLRSAPAVVLGGGALLVALAGTSYAAATINGSDIKKHSISGNRLKNNTLTGKQINESTLRKVPAAKAADSATHAATAGSANLVGGAKVVPFHFMVAPDGSAQNVVIPGGKLRGDCPGNVPDLTLYGNLASPSGVTLVVSGTDATSSAPALFGTGNDNLATTSSASLTPPSPTTGDGTAVIARPSGGETTITYSYEQIEGGCIYAGTAVGTP